MAWRIRGMGWRINALRTFLKETHRTTRAEFIVPRDPNESCIPIGNQGLSEKRSVCCVLKRKWEISTEGIHSSINLSNKLILCFVKPWSMSQSLDDLRHESQNERIDFCSNLVSWRTVHEQQADMMCHVADLRELRKPQNWNLPHFTSDVSGLSGGGGGKEPAEGACGHQSHTACLSCCLESWKGEIIICICLLSQTYGTRKSLLERRCSQLLLTSLTWPRRLLRKVLSHAGWHETQ